MLCGSGKCRSSYCAATVMMMRGGTCWKLWNCILWISFQFSQSRIFLEETNNYSNIQCFNRTCCFISESESCPFNNIDMKRSTMIFPGGNTRCIKSTSSSYGNVILIISCFIFCSIPSLSGYAIKNSILFSRWWELLG